MIRINLLPWREELRTELRNQFVTGLGLTALLGLVVAFAIYSGKNDDIDYQNSRNTRLKTEIRSLDRQIKEIKTLEETRAQLLRRRDVIEQLQDSRARMVHLFDELVRTIPDGIYLTAVKQLGQMLTVTGRAQSDAQIALYLRRLDGSPWMAKPELGVIEVKSKSKDQLKDFKITVTLTNRKETAGESQDAEATK